MGFSQAIRHWHVIKVFYLFYLYIYLSRADILPAVQSWATTWLLKKRAVELMINNSNRERTTMEEVTVSIWAYLEIPPCWAYLEIPPMLGISWNTPMLGISGNTPMLGISWNTPMLGISGNTPHVGHILKYPNVGHIWKYPHVGHILKYPHVGYKATKARWFQIIRLKTVHQFPKIRALNLLHTHCVDIVHLPVSERSWEHLQYHSRLIHGVEERK